MGRWTPFQSSVAAWHQDDKKQEEGNVLGAENEIHPHGETSVETEGCASHVLASFLQMRFPTVSGEGLWPQGLMAV